MTTDTLRESAAVHVDALRDMLPNVTPTPWLYRAKSNSWHRPPPVGTKYTYGDSIMDDDNDLYWRDQEYLVAAINAVPSLLAARDADKARIAVLEGALRPFALAANNYDDRTGETPYQITIGQLRAAREALTTQASEVE